MSGFLDYLFAVVAPRQLAELAAVLPQLLTSLDPYFWLLVVVPMLRFQLPVIVCWLVDVARPGFWSPPPLADLGGRWPFVSVVIAGRNAGPAIAGTIRSVLTCGYESLEVIYVDDGSDDGTVRHARALADQRRVKVFASAERGGKPSALNIGLRMAGGPFVLILDADSDLQTGSIHEWMIPFRDPSVGAVAGNLRVRNGGDTLVTRLQEAEYALNVTMARLWRARLDMLTIVPGAAGLFRAEALRDLFGFDSGLGDDTDMTLRLRKQRWRLGFALHAVVWTDVPRTVGHLVRQRSRWERNMVKVRLRKHGDLLRAWRYGWRNMLVTADLVVVRAALPLLIFAGILLASRDGPGSAPILLTHLYWISAVFSLIKLAIARDLARTPRLERLWLAPLLPLYRVGLRFFTFAAEIRELLRVGLYHAYVPRRVWDQTPHW